MAAILFVFLTIATVTSGMALRGETVGVMDSVKVNITEPSNLDFGNEYATLPSYKREAASGHIWKTLKDDTIYDKIDEAAAATRHKRNDFAPYENDFDTELILDEYATLPRHKREVARGHMWKTLKNYILYDEADETDESAAATRYKRQDYDDYWADYETDESAAAIRFKKLHSGRSKRDLEASANEHGMGCEEPRTFLKPENQAQWVIVGRILTTEINSLLTIFNAVTGDLMGTEDKRSILCELSKLAQKTRDLKGTPGERYTEIDADHVSNMDPRPYNRDEAKYLEIVGLRLFLLRNRLVLAANTVKKTILNSNANDLVTLNERLRALTPEFEEGDYDPHLFLSDIDRKIVLLNNLRTILGRESIRPPTALTDADFFLTFFGNMRMLLGISARADSRSSGAYHRLSLPPNN